jgi:YbgC/YbaW family acyl-CoA thioester hydrolase
MLPPRREQMPATPFVIEEYVRWSDVDFAGIVFYGSYIRFFEIAETELFRHCGLAYGDVFEQHDILLPRKVVHSEFHQPARLDDRLRVAVYVGNVGTQSMTLNFDVMRAEPAALVAAAWMVLVCVDRRELRPRALPAALARALVPHTLPLAAARAALGLPAS